MIIITKERKKSTPKQNKCSSYHARAGGICNFNTCETSKRRKKEESIWYKKKNPCWMKWNEMKYCSLWVSRRWAPEGRWWFARQLWERIQAGASMTLIRSATWIRTDPARIYPPPLLARYLLKWRSGKINASYKNPLFKIFF